jgi:hypothetical protein
VQQEDESIARSPDSRIRGGAYRLRRLRVVVYHGSWSPRRRGQWRSPSFSARRTIFTKIAGIANITAVVHADRPGRLLLRLEFQGNAGRANAEITAAG